MATQDELVDMFDFESNDPAPVGAAEPVVEEAPEATEPPVEAAPVETEGKAPVEAVPAEEAGIDPTTVVVDPPQYMGKYKTPEDMESAFREYQSHADRQLAEERARREAYEHMMSADQQLLQQQQQAESQQPVDVSDEELSSGIERAPIDTFQWAVQNNPSLIPRIIAGVTDKHGTQTGMELQSAWTNIQLQAQQAQMQEQMQSQMNEVLGPQIIQQNIEQGLKAVEEAYGEDFNALRAEVATNLKNLGQLPSYDHQTVAQAVEYSFLQAHRNRALQVATSQSSIRTPSPQESVEAGTPGQAPVTTPTDDIKQGILDAYNSNPFH